MKKYIYKTLQKRLIDNVDYTIDDLNKLGNEGFRIISFSHDDRGNEFVILEKEVNE